MSGPVLPLAKSICAAAADWLDESQRLKALPLGGV